jgi:hypothetical protein
VSILKPNLPNRYFYIKYIVNIASDLLERAKAHLAWYAKLILKCNVRQLAILLHTIRYRLYNVRASGVSKGFLYEACLILDLKIFLAML